MEFKINDKWQLSLLEPWLVTFYLHSLFIFEKNAKSLPTLLFPETWYITHTSNHWANEETTEHYINLILLPCIESIRKSQNTSSAALVIFDRFRGQCTSRILSLLSANNILIALIPGNCTDRLQPLDISINKPAKDFLWLKFQDWYSEKVCEFDETGDKNDQNVDDRLSIIKLLGAQWLMDLHDYMLQKPEIIINGFHGCGILNS